MLLLAPDTTSPTRSNVNFSIRYEQIKHSPPVKIRRWEDPTSHAKGVLIINSLPSGSAHGFIKMSESRSLSKATADARSIAKIVEVEGLSEKSGGACAVLICNPNDPHINEIKKRFTNAIFKGFNVELKSTGRFIIYSSRKSNTLFSDIIKKFKKLSCALF